MSKNGWILYIVSCISFFIIGIMDLFKGKYLSGTPFMILGVLYLYFSISSFKKYKKAKDDILAKIDPERLDSELIKLIDEGREIEAIKTYRILTGASLKDSRDYVDILNGKNA